jgi:hypothetical protein
MNSAEYKVLSEPTMLVTYLGIFFVLRAFAMLINRCVAIILESQLSFILVYNAHNSFKSILSTSHMRKLVGQSAKESASREKETAF